MDTLTFKQVKTMAAVMKDAARFEIMPRFGKIQSEEKQGASGRETVTAADRGGSDYILQRRRLVVPGSFSEEDMDDSRFLYDEVEAYDPVDGTDEFIAGMLDGFAMHGALLRRDAETGSYRSLGGAIYSPGTTKLWYGTPEKIAYERAGKACDFPELKRERICGWMRVFDAKTNAQGYTPDSELVSLVETMKQYYRKIGDGLRLDVEIVPGGGSGASFIDLLEGKINLIVTGWHDSKEWDIAMAAPLVKARGGFLCDFAGQEYTYNRRDVLNRNGYVASVAFKKKEILPHLSLDMVLTRRRPA